MRGQKNIIQEERTKHQDTDLKLINASPPFQSGSQASSERPDRDALKSSLSFISTKKEKEKVCLFFNDSYIYALILIN